MILPAHCATNARGVHAIEGWLNFLQPLQPILAVLWQPVQAQQRSPDDPVTPAAAPPPPPPPPPTTRWQKSGDRMLLGHHRMLYHGLQILRIAQDPKRTIGCTAPNSGALDSSARLFWDCCCEGARRYGCICTCDC